MKSLNIVTWNVQWCKGIDGKIDAQRIIDGAYALCDFDILCLQEISVNFPGLTEDTPADQVALFQSLLPNYHIAFGAAIDEQPSGQVTRQQFGNLIASRLPILRTQRINLPSPVDTNSPLPGMERMCLTCTVQAPWGPLRIMTTHLEYYSQPQRLAQAKALFECHDTASLRATHPTPEGRAQTPYQAKPETLDAFLCGDFNFTAESAEYQQIIQQNCINPWFDAWPLCHPDQPHDPTFHLYDHTYGPEPVCCDFFFISQSLRSRVQSIRVDTQTQASDHQPVHLVLGGPYSESRNTNTP